MSRRKLIVFSALALLILGGGAAGIWWYWFRSEAPPTAMDLAASGPRYRVATISLGDVVETITVSGMLNAVANMRVSVEVSDAVRKLYTEYDKARNAAHATNSITNEIKVAEAGAELASAVATLELEQIDPDLVNSPDLSLDEMDAPETDPNDPARTSTASAKDDPDGELPYLSQDLRQIQVAIEVLQTAVYGVQPGQPATFTINAFPGRTFRAAVKQVSKNVMKGSKVLTYLTIIMVDDTDPKILPGMIADVTIPLERRVDVLRVKNSALNFKPPVDAILRSPPPTPKEGQSIEPVLYVLAKKPKRRSLGVGELIPTRVGVGFVDTTYTEITSGIGEGAVVAIENVLPAAPAPGPRPTPLP